MQPPTVVVPTVRFKTITWFNIFTGPRVFAVDGVQIAFFLPPWQQRPTVREYLEMLYAQGWKLMSADKHIFTLMKDETPSTENTVNIHVTQN